MKNKSEKKKYDIFEVVRTGQQSLFTDGSFNSDVRCAECNERVSVAKNDVLYSRNDPERQKEDFVVNWLEMKCGHTKFYVKTKKDILLRGIDLSSEIDLEKLKEHEEFIFMKIMPKMTVGEIIKIFKDCLE